MQKKTMNKKTEDAEDACFVASALTDDKWRRKQEASGALSTTSALVDAMMQSYILHGFFLGCSSS